MDKYKISNKAQRDLIDIWDFTKYKWSKKQANKYIKDILKEFKFLSKNKSVGKSCDEIRKGYYRFPKASHIIFYKKIEDSEIEVIRVLHKSSDVVSKF